MSTVPILEGYRISPEQRRAWVVQQNKRAELGASAVVMLEGRLDGSRFRSCVDQIAKQYEILRTNFQQLSGMTEPLQVISDDSEWQWGTKDLTGYSAQEQQEIVSRAAGRCAQQMSVELISLADRSAAVVFCMPALVTDRMGLIGLVRAVILRYLGEGQESAMQVQYADIAQSLNESLESPEFDTGRSYWMTQWSGKARQEALAKSLCVHDGRPFQKASERVQGIAGQSAAILRRCNEWNCIPQDFLLACWLTLALRHSEGWMPVFGFGGGGRDHEVIAEAPGLLVRYLPVWVDVNLQTPLREMVDKVAAATSEAVGWQQFFDWNQIESAERIPILRWCFESCSMEESIGGEAIHFQIAGVWGISDGFAQRLVVQEWRKSGAHAELSAEIDYDAAGMRAQEAQWLAEELETVVEGALARPEAAIGALPIIGRMQREMLCVWNQTKGEYARDKCVHELFEEQVERTPDAVAASYGEEQVSYGHLNRRANRLAHYLISLGVKPDDRVAICVERGLEMVIGILGILKAGAAYIPLDPSYPAERLRFMVEDSSPVVVMTQESLRGMVEGIVDEMRVVELSGVMNRPGDREEERNPGGLGTTSQNLCYVIYTSGSTGTPKGVMVEHRALLNHMEWMQREFRYGPNDRILQRTPISFDASVWEFFAPLLCGGKLVLLRSEVHADVEFLTAILKKERITVVQMVPMLLTALVEVGGIAAAEELRLVCCGGELLKTELVQRCLQQKHVEIVNLYAPTEATIDATYWRGMKVPFGTGIPIGRPIRNTQLHVLDWRGDPVPVGVAGEIYIGGAGVARGYLKRPELTAERFVPDPYAEETGARMYRTGDLGRWLEAGNIEFVGRNDDQVKIRGYRIELGEIEVRLAEHEQVREAAVVVREYGNAEKRLVAYVVAESEPDEEDLAGRLRAYLVSRLPEYMVPAAYVRLEEMPLTPNGKLDRKALPAPEGKGHAQRMYEAPRGEIEEKLAILWQELLGVEHVGRHDNFFELGGHSLLAVQLVEQLHRLDLQVEVRALFTTPVLSELASTLDHYREALIPPALIKPDSTVITPEMLPLIDLKQEEIDQIIKWVPGGTANIQEIYALSPLQKGILFHHLMGGEGDPYLLAVHLSFESRTRLDSYVKAMRAVIERHDILRTAVLWEGLREPVQMVWREVVLPLEEVELDPAAGDVAGQLHARFNPRQYRIDVRQAPLLRVYIAKDEEKERWLMVLLLHHLAGDHVTLEVMQEEIEGHLLGRVEQLPVPLPFRNLVAQARLGVSPEEDQAFFRQLLGDVTEPTAPFGLLDAQGDGTGIEEAQIALDLDVARRVRESARKLRVSAASLCHMAWAQVLARVSGREDVVFGTVLFGRMQGGGVGAGRVTGPSINTLPVRIQIGNEGVEAGVRRVHRQLSDLLRHEHASLALAQRCSGVAAPTPLFSALLNYRHSSGPVQGVSEDRRRAWKGIRVLYGQERTNYPVTLSVDDLGQGFMLTAQVAARIGSMRVCEYMHTALKSLVEALESTPGRAISSLEVLPEKERKQLLYEWNATGMEYPREKCVQELFEEQVQKTPEAVAVVSEEESVSYDDLNRRANRLAHHLREIGVRADERVGVCAERGVDMVVALLATLKAGGAYVPLDPEYPDDRLQYMVKNASPAAVLTQPHLQERLKAFSGRDLPVIALSPAVRWQEQSAANCERDEGGVNPERLAYVIYTSGSTGTPKGVMIEHRSIVNRLIWMQNAYGLKTEDAVLQKTPFSFDVSVWEFFWPLLFGAQLVMARPGGHKDPMYLSETIERNRITTLHFVPSMLHAFLELGDSRRCSSVKRIICSGEALSAAVAWCCREVLPWAELHNLYGPTEATVDVTSWAYPASGEKATMVPIGRPIANTRVYILDKNMQPVPVGVMGELYIGGVQVARGYLNREDLTAERFVKDPFASQPGAQIYRTGDLAQWLEDGNIEYLGRNDYQVKIRGYRIELGEIEAQLSQHPRVREAVVVARQDGDGGKRLVAYVVVAESKVEEERVWHGLEEGGEVEAGELSSMLRTYLAGQLPEYMVPATYVRLERMPLTPNGKLDRRALPEPERDADARRGYEEPQGETESKLAKIWEKLLETPQVGRHDNFFELGGHSLLVIQLMVEVQRSFGINISVRDVFMSPTLAELAAALKRGDLAIRHENLIPVRPAGTQTPLFVVHALGGVVNYVADLAPFINADIPIYGLQATGFAPGEEPLKTIEEMAELYVDGIRQVQPHGPYRVAGWSAGGTIAYEMARRLIEMGEQVGFVGLLDTNYFERKTMDSENGPPKDFDANFELIQILSMILDKEDFDSVTQMAQIYDFETLIERGNHIKEKIAKEYPVHTLDVSVLLRLLKIRHATANAQFNYSFVRLSMPVWLFEARESEQLSGPGWRRLLGDDIQVVPVQGTHHTMTIGLENLRSLGAAITGALAKNSMQIVSFPLSHPFTRSAAEV